MRTVFSKAFLVTSAAVTALYAGAPRADEPKFVQTNLVSDIDDLARITDPQLVNPWGVSHSRTSPFWVSNQGKNTATLYTVIDETNVSKVNINPPKGFVAIPTAGAGPECNQASRWGRKPFRPGTGARRPLSRRRGPRGRSIPGWRSTADNHAFMPPIPRSAASTPTTAPSPR